MNEIVSQQKAISSANPIPDPGIPISFRVGTLDDLPAIDALQKQYHKELGFFPRAQMEGYLKNGWVIAATETSNGRLVGYCVSRDRYLKRDELGVIFQLCVEPGAQRKFVGTALLKEVFERSPYGCRLYCCWCAQDLAANRFWESMGFVPLAFRSGSAKRGKKGAGRTHIFWQKRILAGDRSTPYWFPSQTGGGAIGSDRLVLPIPDGMRWGDQMPVLLPGGSSKSEVRAVGPVQPDTPKQIQNSKSEGSKRKAMVLTSGPTSPKRATPPTLMGTLRFGPPVEVAKAVVVEKKRLPRKKEKIDPQHAAMGRELRDRWLDRNHSGNWVLESAGKYDPCRALPSMTSSVNDGSTGPAGLPGVISEARRLPDAA